jgi:hypothetical protein
MKIMFFGHSTYPGQSRWAVDHGWSPLELRFHIDVSLGKHVFRWAIDRENK